MTKSVKAVRVKLQKPKTLTREEEGERLYKEALERCPHEPDLFIAILFSSGEVAESEILEEYINARHYNQTKS